MILNKLSVGWRKYSGTIPIGYSSVAVISHSNGWPPGVLVESFSDGKYHQANGGQINATVIIDQGEAAELVKELYGQRRRKQLIDITVRIRSSERTALSAFMDALRLQRKFKNNP